MNATEIRERLAAGLPYRAEMKRTVRGIFRAVPALLDLIDDALQNAWVVAWEAAQNENLVVNNLRAWTATIVRRGALNELRTFRGRNLDALTEENAPAVPVVDNIALREALARVMEALTPRQALVLQDRVIHGLGTEEIAEKNGMETATVMNILSLARKALRGVGLDETVLKGAV